MPAQRKPHKQYPGVIKTARGRMINMNELKNRQTKPIPSAQPASTVAAQEKPKSQVHVTGFMPSMHGVQQPPKMGDGAVAQARNGILGQMGEPDEGPAIADYTGIEIRHAPGMQQAYDPSDPDAQTEAYKSIMKDLHTQVQSKGLPPRSNESRRARKA